MSKLTALLTLIFLAYAGVAHAAGSSDTSSSGSASNNDFVSGRALVKQEKYGSAIPLLEKAVASEPRNADYLTELAFAYRKTGKLDESYAAYDKALTADPEHKGALNYLGMLYLQTDQKDKAMEMLDRLDRACFLGCKEYDDLKAAIEGGAAVY